MKTLAKVAKTLTSAVTTPVRRKLTKEIMPPTKVPSTAIVDKSIFSPEAKKLAPQIAETPIKGWGELAQPRASGVTRQSVSERALTGARILKRRRRLF
ncbi:MAG: hypothetical protein QME51_04210 [Planctomycetota bacterium]|nr:hypothetical protein [Planctomycetota bacterium]